ncbi:MAG: hypothetical protein ACRD8Z_17525 [Nitrososphaeraceae archaeon]
MKRRSEELQSLLDDLNKVRKDGRICDVIDEMQIILGDDRLKEEKGKGIDLHRTCPILQRRV